MFSHVMRQYPNSPFGLQETIKRDIIRGVKTNEIHLTTFFKAEDVLPHCGDMSRDEVIRALVSGIVQRNKLPGGDGLANEVLAREQASSTVIMDGLALPHSLV